MFFLVSMVHAPLFQPCAQNETIHEPCRVESRKHQTCYKPHVCQLVGCCCCCYYCCFCCCCFKPLQDVKCFSWFQWYMLLLVSSVHICMRRLRAHTCTHVCIFVHNDTFCALADRPDVKGKCYDVPVQGI